MAGSGPLAWHCSTSRLSTAGCHGGDDEGRDESLQDGQDGRALHADAFNQHCAERRAQHDEQQHERREHDLGAVFCVFEHGGSLRAGLGLLATERLRPAGGSLGEAHPRWFQSYERDWLSRRSVAMSTVAAAASRSKRLSRSAASGGCDGGALAMNVAGRAAHLLDGREGRLLSERRVLSERAASDSSPRLRR